MMKRYYPISLVTFFIALVAGCGPDDTTNQNLADAQANEQNPQTMTSREANGSNTSVEQQQRTGIPFQVRQTSQDTLPLLAIMINLEQNLAAVQAGIWRADYQTIGEAATALVNHAKIPEREVQKIEAILGEEGLDNFVAADENWHQKAKELAQVANEKRMEQIVNLTTELIQRCSNCHVAYRTPLRDSPKWLER